MPAKTKTSVAVISADIKAYNKSQSKPDKEICDLLAETITAQLKGAENKSGMHIPFGLLMAIRLPDTVN